MFEVDASAFDAGVERLEEKFTRVGKVASDASPLWPKVGEVFAEFQRQVFASGHNWPALSPETVRIKKDATILVGRTGLLRSAATSPVPVEANAVYAKFGLTHGEVPYAHWHARGAGVPRREPVPNLSASTIQDILRVVAERVREEFAR